MAVEPVTGAAGCFPLPPGYLTRLRALCDRYGILLIADEVITGFGRTGAWFGVDHEGVVPDIVTTAKGLGGGLPIGGVTARAEIINQVHAGGLGGTFGGNPLSCAAALAAIIALALIKRLCPQCRRWAESVPTRALQLGPESAPKPPFDCERKWAPPPEAGALSVRRQSALDPKLPS